MPVTAGMSCNNADQSGNVLPTDITPLQYGCLYDTASLNATELAECPAALAPLNITEAASRRRSGSSSYPSQSTFTLTFSQLVSSLNPMDQAAFLAAVQLAWSIPDVAGTIANQSGFTFFPAGMFLNYTMNTPGAIVPLDPAHGLLMKGSASTSPVLVDVLVAGVGSTFSAGDTFVLTFSTDTNVPSTDPVLNTVNRTDLDKMVVFTPSIGSEAPDAYFGQWISRSQLLITVVHPTNNTKVDSSPYVLTVSFKLPLLAPGIPSGDPCIGASVCGTSGPT